MRFFGVLFFVAAMWYSWNLSHMSPPISVQIHTDIQAELENLIVRVISDHRPQAQNIEVTKIWTKAMAPTRMQAYFAYAYDEPDDNGDIVTQQIQGEATLNKTGSAAQENAWSLDDVTVTGQELIFQQGFIISPRMGR